MEFAAGSDGVIGNKGYYADIGCDILKCYFNGIVIIYLRNILNGYISASHDAQRCTNNKKGLFHINGL